MPEYEYGRKRSVHRRHIGVVLLYAAVLAALFIAAVLMRETGEENSFGSLKGRFDSEIALTWNGETVHYREAEITNYLLIGTDRESLGATGHQDGGQADFLLVLSIDRKNRSITPVMIDRDVMTPVMTYGVFGNASGTRTMQICLAQAFSGAKMSGSENTANAVSGLLGGVIIDRCVLMDIAGIAVLNDAIGGVSVTLEDDLTALDPALSKGATVCLQGDLAEHFVRGRMTVADGTNASRMRRQKTYIDALVRQISSLHDSDGDFLETVLNSLSGHIQTETAQSTLLSDVNAYGDYAWQEMRSLSGTHRTGIDGFAEFWADEQALMDMVVEIWFA